MPLLEIARIVFALAAVIGMIGLAALAAKKLGLAGANGFQRTRRLQLVETLAFDQKRRAAILRCDGREHLILLDAASVTVIDRDIPAAPPTEAAPATPVNVFIERLGARAGEGAAKLRAAGAS
jgi:flagellar protein FliO/FliZ